MKMWTLVISALGASVMFTASAQADVCGSGLELEASSYLL